MTAGTQAPADDIRHKVLRGLGWVAASQIALQLVRLGVAVAVARMLTPSEYGLAALALVFASLVLVFSDLSLGAALVQRKQLSEDDRSTAFWVMCASGVLFTLAGLALAGPVADLYGHPEARPLLTALSASFILTAVGATYQALLLREMDFRRLELLTVAGALAGGAAAVTVAALDGGAWAIIAQQLVTATITSALFVTVTPWRPSLRFSKASLKHLWGFSGYLVGHRLLFYLHQNADRFIIGRFVGTAALGAYAVAYNLMLVPAGRIGGPLQRVLAPAFSRMQDEPQRIASAWARVSRYVAVVAVPALVGLAVVAPDFVPVVLGERWEEAVPLVQVLAWVGILQALQSSHVDVLMARGRTGTIFRYSCGFCAAHVIAFVIGAQWGVVGVAIAYALSSTLVEPVLTVLTARCLGVSPLVFVRAVAGVFAASAGMAACAVLTRVWLIDVGVGQAARLALVIALAALAFAPLCLWLVPELRRDVRALARRLSPRPPLPTPVES